MNKKSIDKIDIFTLEVNYIDFMKKIFNINNLEEFINFINNDIDEDLRNIYIYDRLFEYCWYVFIDEIIIYKNKFIELYIKVLNMIYKKNISVDKFEIIYNDNIKKYTIEKNNINYHKIILEYI
jgi:hypothetical protein